MKLITIGDVHGRNFWKQIADTQTFDKLILIGDYFDSYNISIKDQFNNFLEIVAYKKAHPDKMILLIGNHDFHYLPEAMASNERYTGYQERYGSQISLLLNKHLYLFQMCYEWNNYLFTHAGVTQTWLDGTGFDDGDVALFINDLFEFKPRKFFFNGTDPTGNDVTQSPIWVRPNSLLKDGYNRESVRQVVGHTVMKKLTIVEDNFFFIDTSG